MLQEPAAREHPVTVAGPAVTDLAADVYVIATDAPEADGTLAWAETTMVLSANCAPNLHAHVGAATPNLRHVEYFHDHQRIEQLLFDGALDPQGGALRPDPGRPGLGLRLRAADAERCRRP